MGEWEGVRDSEQFVELVDGEAGVLQNVGQCRSLDRAMCRHDELERLFGRVLLESNVTTTLAHHSPPVPFGPPASPVEIRQRRARIQVELGEAVGVSNRVIAYYEQERALPKKAGLMKRLQKVEELPSADQRAVLKMVDALHEARRRNGSQGMSRPSGR